MGGRLANAMKRRDWDREQARLVEGAPLDIAASPPPTHPRTMGPEALVPMLLQAGIRPAYQVRVDPEHQVACLIAVLGPVQVPLPFDPAGARKLAGELSAAADAAEAGAARFVAGDGTVTDRRPGEGE
jgi:hypothetical protein